MGYTGPAQKDDMDAFLASSPSAASKLGRYADIARQRIEGGPLAPTGFAEGSSFNAEVVEKLRQAARRNPRSDRSDRTGMLQSIEGQPELDPKDARLSRGVMRRPGESDEEYAYRSGLKNRPSDTNKKTLEENIESTFGLKPVSRIKDTDKGRLPLDDIDPIGPPEDFMRPIDDTGDQQEDQPDDGTQEAFQPGPVLKEGTETPEVSEAAKLLDEAQEAYASSTRSLTEIQQAMSGKDPEEIYKNRDYTSVEDGTPEERKAAGTSLSTKILRHVTGLEELTPEDIAKYDVDGDGQLTVGDNIQYLRMGTGLQEPNEAFTEFFLNKYPSTPVTYQQALEEAELAQTQAAALVSTQQKAFDIEAVPSTGEALGKAISTPSAILAQPTVYGLEVKDDQLIDSETGQVADALTLLVKQAQAADEVENPAVKRSRAYLEGLSDKERMEKYPPYPYAVPMVYPLPERFQKDMDEYYASQQAQIEQDAAKASTETYDAIESNAAVKSALSDFAAATGSPSDDALMDAATMKPEELEQLKGRFKDPASLDVIREVSQVVRSLQEGEQPDAALFDKYTTAPDVTFEGEVEEIDPAKFEDETPEAKPEVDYTLPPSQIAEVEKSKVEDAANFGDYATAPEKKSEFVPDVTAEQTTVSDDELADVNDILNGEEVIVTAKTLEALNEDATAKAATATFTQQLEAKFVKGEVSAASTVSFQMEKLMMFSSMPEH